MPLDHSGPVWRGGTWPTRPCQNGAGAWAGTGTEKQAAVVGAGVIGCSIALELLRRGFAVRVIDRNGDAGHGSTSASCGIARRYYSQPGMIAIVPCARILSLP
jgi:NADPH-dependent 2,4-dienoyl-CoA reductase/sulfur reductase-like enzyme